MDDETSDGSGPLPPNLRFLRNLVTVLTGVMILGVITVIVLLVIRLSDARGPVLVHPDVFDFPEGVEIVGYSVVNGYTILIGDDGVIRVYASDTRNQVDALSLQER